jgi:hypothetical protein
MYFVGVLDTGDRHALSKASRNKVENVNEKLLKSLFFSPVEQDFPKAPCFPIWKSWVPWR